MDNGIRYLWHGGAKKGFRNLKKLRTYAEANGLSIKLDKRDDSDHTYVCSNESAIEAVAAMKPNNMHESNFKTTDEQFKDFFAGWCVTAKQKGCWTEPENLHDAMEDAFLAGIGAK
jgi:hypothetical protein